MKKVITLLLILMCLAPMFAGGQKEANSYVFAANCAWPPLEFVDEKGDIVGFEIDLIKEFATMTGYNMSVRNVAWDGIFAGLSNGAYDAIASGVSVTEERKPAMEFTTPVLYVTQSIIVHQGTQGMADLQGLNGKKVGVQLGTTGHIALEDAVKAQANLNIDIKAYDEVGFAVEDLMNGNLDAVVCDSLIASDYVLSNQNYAGKLTVSGVASEITEPIAIAVKKGNLEFTNLLNDCIEKLNGNGKMAELKAKWNLL
ncbi:MAG: transporter substrate-binding domain-containing protein [Sphaerochaetaceae bacterium]|nr:transporter substrate-binding domain-containing protein [Sphaerochaetaceae bacterium]